MATLKISDLSVGDWVNVILNKCDYDDPETLDAKVLSIEGNSVGVGYDNSGIVMSAFVEDLQPIPITAEILERNGFEPCSSYWTIYKDTGGHIEIWEDEDKWYLSVNCVEYILCDLHWVHQIQHLMRVWGFDKEINL